MWTFLSTCFGYTAWMIGPQLGRLRPGTFLIETSQSVSTSENCGRESTNSYNALPMICPRSSFVIWIAFCRWALEVASKQIVVSTVDEIWQNFQSFGGAVYADHVPRSLEQVVLKFSVGVRFGVSPQLKVAIFVWNSVPRLSFACQLCFLFGKLLK